MPLFNFVEFSSYVKPACSDVQPLVQQAATGKCLSDVLRVGSSTASYFGTCGPNGQILRTSCDDAACNVNCNTVTVGNGTCVPFGSGGYIAQCLEALPSPVPVPVDPPLGGKGTVVGIALGTVFGGLFITLFLLYCRRRARGSGTGCFGFGYSRGHTRYIKDRRGRTLKQMLPRMSLRGLTRHSMAPGIIDFNSGKASSASSSSLGADRAALQEYEATIAAATAAAAAVGGGGGGGYEPQREGAMPGATAAAGSSGSLGVATTPSPPSRSPGAGFAPGLDRRSVVLAASSPSGYFSIEQTRMALPAVAEGSASGGSGDSGAAAAPGAAAIPLTPVIGWGTNGGAQLAVTPFSSSNALPKASAFPSNGTASVLSPFASPVAASSGGAASPGSATASSSSSGSSSLANTLRPLSSRLAVLSQAFKPAARGGGGSSDHRASLRVGTIETRNPIPSISVHQTPVTSPRIVVGPVLTQLSPRATAGGVASVPGAVVGAAAVGAASSSSSGGGTTTSYVNPSVAASGYGSGSGASPLSGSPAVGGGLQYDEEGGGASRTSLPRRGEGSPLQPLAASGSAASGAMWAAAGISVSPHPGGGGTGASSRGSTPSMSRVSSPPALTPSSSERRLSTLGEAAGGQP